MRRRIFIAIAFILLSVSAAPAEIIDIKPPDIPATPEYYKPYLKLLEEVYNKMDEAYYKPVSRAAYDRYVEKYKVSVLSKVDDKTKRIDKIAYMGAGLMVNMLKDPHDKFTNFIPPKEAKEYSQKVYGYELGIGIEGHMSEKGYAVDHVQIRSDAFNKGVRPTHIILKIDSLDVKALDEKKIRELLYPPLNSVVKLEVLGPKSGKISTCEVKCQEYFNETVKNIDTGRAGIACLKIAAFNRMTGEDLKNYIKELDPKKTKLVILDLRDNPGGPPLAVHELSGIFLPPKEKLFYYKKKNSVEFGLLTPTSDVHYNGPLVILINKRSGSASEIMAAIFKEYKRGFVMGTEPTAGMAFLKSTFTFEDGSMLAMITGDAFLFNGVLLDTGGVTPNYIIPADVKDTLGFVADKYLKKEILKDFSVK